MDNEKYTHARFRIRLGPGLGYMFFFWWIIIFAGPSNTVDPFFCTAANQSHFPTRSGFMFFSQDKRPKLREQNPGASVGDLAKQLGAAWKVMTDDQKAPYEKQAKKDRARYEADMELYRKGEYRHKQADDHEQDDDEDDEED